MDSGVRQNDGRRGYYGGISFWNGNGTNGINGANVYNNTIYIKPTGVSTDSGWN